MTAMTITLMSTSFGADDDFDPRDCVGNDRVWIEAQYSRSSARCACGATVKLLAQSGRSDGEVWVHANGSPLCPPYDCACGQRHNVRSL